MNRSGNRLLLVVATLGTMIGALWVYKTNQIEAPPPLVSPWIPPNIDSTGPPPNYTFRDAVDSIKQKEIKDNLYYLASDELEGRMSGKRGNIVSAEWIKRKYESFGLPTMYQRFSIRRENPGPKNEIGDDFTQNVYAWIDGSDPLLKDEIVIVGAHLDHIGYGPRMSQSPRRREIHNGADDNGTGTVALIAIAKAFSMLKGKVKRTVVFQSYSAEEMGLIGSRYYCNNPIFPKDNPSIKKHVAMINMDMIGRLGRTVYYGKSVEDSSVDISSAINTLSNKYSFARRITSRGGGGSDHASFYNKRIPVATLHTGMHRDYHTPDDDSDKINYEGLTNISKYCFELVWKIAQSDSAPRFNHTNFRPLPYSHDHDHPNNPFYKGNEK